ncbi:MAG: prepilin-type N-terminal cleavage/methylation domain-containing protein [bacterium]|nr:prepilin-type N-terminal cleavage/methylation domain-containing protein [bacterium]
MKEKGFTLIELLAVIVILAIIALIAVPIIIDIIEDSKKEALKRSAENYLKAVELAIAKENLNGEFNPNNCTIESGITKCGDKTLNVTVDGEIPDSGEFTLVNGTIKKDSTMVLTYKDKSLTYSSGKLVLGEADLTKYIKLGGICKVVDSNENDTIDVGEKTFCQVNDENNYTFYVLSIEGSNVNLIMERNVYYNSDTDYGLADETHTGEVEWISKADFNDDSTWKQGPGGNSGKGPITAMRYLYNATKDWTNVPNLKDANRELPGIETISGVTKMKDKSGNYVDGFELTNLKARLPYSSEIADANGTNSYLYDYIDLNGWGINESYKPENSITGINGYWTASAAGGFISYYAIYIYNWGSVNADALDMTGVGVRPVITLSIN